MHVPHALSFPPFRLDLRNQRLWRGSDEVDLKPMALAVLRFLAMHSQQLIAKEELVRAVWGETRISPETLRSTLREVRRGLQDDAKAPRWIETVHGRGYRFLEPVESLGAAIEREATPSVVPSLVGRAPAFAQLREWFATARAGSRRVGFVEGEPGIGKTTIAEAFLTELRQNGDAICAHGQCVSGYGGSEPYMPILDALGRACRQPNGQRLVDLLGIHAPTWLAQMPGLLGAASQRPTRAGPTGSDRMLRELAETIEAISAEEPFVILLEDLHWSDAATLDAIDVLARRSEPARLLILCTHRAVTAKDAHGRPSSLASMRAELRLHHLCEDLTVDRLSERDTRAYIDLRFPGLDTPEDLSRFVYGRTAGNPLMMASHADELVRAGRLVPSESGWRTEGDPTDLGIPEGVRQMIEHQIDLLPAEEQRTLQSASVVGVRFSGAVVQGLDPAVRDVDEHLSRLGREGRLIQAHDGDRYEFVHALHQEILYERIPSARKRALHEKIGLRLERDHRDDTAPVAAPLAMHFERGGDVARAVRYLHETAEVAIQRSSHEEASVLVRRALGLLESQPDTLERRQTEFGLQATLGNCLTLTKGYVDPEVRAAFDRAVELSADVDAHTPDLMSVLAGLCGFYELRGEHRTAGEVSRQQLQIAERTGDPYDSLLASVSRGITCFSVGRYDEAAQHLSRGREGYDADLYGPAAKPHPTDPGVLSLGHGSLVFGALGRLDQAREWSRDAIALSNRLQHPASQVVAYYYAMTLAQLFRDVDQAESDAQTCIALSTEHGFPYYIPAAMVVSGWALAHRGRADEGGAQASGGIEILQGAGAVLGQPLYLSMLAEAYLEAGRMEAGLGAAEEGLRVVETTGETTPESTLHWVKGELLLRASGRASEGEPCFARGLEIANGCGARTQALGPATSLARLWNDQGKRTEAMRLLEESTDGLTPSFDVPVLREAKSLLAQL